jgi:hypothetical protein
MGLCLRSGSGKAIAIELIFSRGLEEKQAEGGNSIYISRSRQNLGSYLFTVALIVLSFPKEEVPHYFDCYQIYVSSVTF